MISNIRTLAALLMAGAAFAACSNSDDSIEQPANAGEKVYTLTINATKGDNAATRALSLNSDGVLSASWVTTDVIYVTKGTTAVGTLSPSSISADGQSATFTGTLDGTKFAVDDVLTLTYHPINGISGFAAQDGTLSGTSGAENFDVATATVTVKEIVGTDITIKETGASFATQTAMIKLTLTTNGTTTINATSLKVSVAGEDIITFSPAADAYTTNGNGILYFALPNAAAIAAAKNTTTTALALAPITFTASDGTNTYVATKTGYPFAAGTYYASTLTMEKPAASKALASVTSSELGWRIGSDGKAYEATGALPTGVTAVAKIVYVGSDNGEASPYNHGLALALSDANNGNRCSWKTSKADAGHTKQTSSSFESESGLQYNATHDIDDYPAFKAAIANNGTAAPTGCSAWFLPSGYQWMKMMTAAGSFSTLRDGFASVGGKNLRQDYYWSSTECNETQAWYYNFLYSSSWDKRSKDWDQNYVRSCLAF